MNYLMDDFQDEHEDYRLKHIELCGIEPYGDLYFRYMPQNIDGLLQHATKNPTYHLSSLPSKEARVLFNSLGNIARYKEFDDRDSPEDLYQPNNQVILDPCDMPDQPIDPYLFLSRVVSELTNNGVVIADSVKDLLVLMCRLFNFSIVPNKPIPQGLSNLVFPAQTGIGKSVSLQVYVSMLEEHSSMIVVPKVEEAIAYCENINNLSGNPDYARCFYSITDKNSDSDIRVEAKDLYKYRCIVITHNMFLRLNQEEKIEAFSIYNDTIRDFTSIDEKLALYQKHQLGFRQFDKVISGLEKALQGSKQLCSISTSHNATETIQDFKKYLMARGELLVSDDSSVVVEGDVGVVVLLGDILTGIGESLNYSDQRKKFPKKLIGVKNKQAVLSALENNYIRYQEKKRTAIGCSFTGHAGIFTEDMRDVDPFYQERLDPILANFTSRARSNSEQNIEMFDSQFGDNSLSRVVYESPIGLAILVAKIIFEERVKEIFQELKSFGSDSNPSFEGRVLNQMNDWLDNLHYLAEDHVLLHKTNFETTVLTTKNITNQLGLSVVLDATAQINQYYQLANRFLGHVGFVKAPQIRKYENLSIHKASGFNQSRSAFYRGKTQEEQASNAKAYASYVINELEDGDKLLIICHLDFKGSLRKQIKDTRVAYTHWGNHVGRNDWSDCNKIMLIGWNYLNPVEHICAINSSLDSVSLTSRHLDDQLLESFEVSQLADDIVQGLMRSQARIISTTDSDCKPTSFYFFYKDDEKSKKVVELVESQFPKATINNWVPIGSALPKKKTKPEMNADLIIDLLNKISRDHDTYLRSSVAKDLNINKTTMNRLVKSPYLIGKLAENGYVLMNKDGKSQQFILK